MGLRGRFGFATAGLALGLGGMIALLAIQPRPHVEAPACPGPAVSAVRAYDDRPVLCGRSGALLRDDPARCAATALELLSNAPYDPEVAITDASTPSELLAILSDGRNSRGLRSRAARALGHVRPTDEPIQVGLHRALADSEQEVAAAAMEALCTLGVDLDALVPALLAVLEDPAKSELQPQAALSLGPIGRRAAVVLPALQRWGAISGGAHAAAAAARFGKAALPWLDAALVDEDDRGQSFALTVLEKMGPEGASLAPRLIRLAAESEKYGRAWRVITVVARMGPAARTVVPDIVRIVLGAAEAEPLTHLWLHLLPDLGPDGEAALRGLLDSGGPEVRMSACRQLATRYPRSLDTRSRIQRLADEDREEEVRDRARWVLHRLDAR